MQCIKYIWIPFTASTEADKGTPATNYGYTIHVVSVRYLSKLEQKFQDKNLSL